jgi:6-phosphogluconolactonase
MHTQFYTMPAKPFILRQALSGGSTPLLMFRALAVLPVPWARVQIFQVDERVAPHGSEDRNFTHLTRSLVELVDIPSKNVHAGGE